MLQKEPRLLLGQEIHQVRCLAKLEYFKKLMWHGNSWGFHCSVRGEVMWNPSKMKLFAPEFLVKNSETCLFRNPEMSASYFVWKKRMFSNELGNHLCQIRIDGPSRSWVISEFCSPLQKTRSPFLYDRNLEYFIAIHICDFHLNFLSFEAFEWPKSGRMFAAPSGTLLNVRLPKMKHHIITRCNDRYPWILYCWIAYFVGNTNLV
jgi:hypothetical protein